MTISQYVDNLQSRYKLGIATEHTYRGFLQDLLESIATGVTVTNEPARIKCGAPDYIITRNEIPVGYVEAKDIGKDIGHKDYKEQFDRYRKALPNLIITDYLNFWLYIDGELKTTLKIAEIVNGEIKPVPENFEAFNAFIRSFCTHVSQTIKSSQKLAVMMADKAKLLSQTIEAALNSDVENAENSTLNDQMHAFKDILIHDIKPREFADIYAQTIAYGMFAARLHDPTLPTFSRQEAAELIPKTNPFLRKLFQYIAGVDLDSRIVWIVDALADIFRATDVAALLQNFGKATQMNDPIIHFYETFLSEYDPALRKARGVWYTPEPVVNFIVRAVDDILKTEFNLPNGLADNSKIKIKQKVVTKATSDMRSKNKEVETEVEVHKVQILDPATGTGTFLAEVVKHVYNKYKGQQGIWSSYVENHLIPRLNGFELLMASYAMAHLKLDMLLTETGYKPTRDQRFKIYLTNSLEEHHPDTSTLFANWLSSEANEANHVKRDAPVMVVMGNPPYSISSNNKSAWILNLIADYKKDLNERKINLDDDYIKFIRYGQHFIDKNGEGILAYISNNSFLDGITHRQMRKHLLNSFDKIYIIDLHGNAKKKETTLEGLTDHNVFDIQQGVSINILIKTKEKKKDSLGTVYQTDLYGKRDDKYRFLKESNLVAVKWNTVTPIAPNYFFVPKDFQQSTLYELGFKLDTLFNSYNSGIQTKRDSLTIRDNVNSLNSVIQDMINEHEETVRIKYDLPSDGRDWTIKTAKEDLKKGYKIIPILYRPFDIKVTAYTGRSKGFLAYPREKTTKDLINNNNYALIFERSSVLQDYSNLFITKTATDLHVIGTAFSNGYTGSIYSYPLNTNQITTDLLERTPNLNKEIIQQTADKIGLTFTNEKEQTENTFAPIDVLDYIYAVLHSPTYRQKYKEFLKIDFPRVPYPKDADTFWQLVKLGGQIRQLHLLESSAVDNYITSYPQDGDNVVNAIRYDAGKVYINQTQYFDNIPASTWQFYIGGYQPAQKWLKDRKGRELSFDDILHYQRMMVALHETERLMGEIDKLEIE